MEKWIRFLRMITSIRGGTDVKGTIEEISTNTQLRGANVWMLFCSSILASIGLDLNSTAVIIGAMLISPLMSPILAVGLGIAIFDKRLLWRGLQSLATATVIALGTSTVYFFISPFGELTQELAARTTPTLLDIGVAFFGGVAGIVAGSRKSKTSAIPGVAIATALMPPICTAGYGLARYDSGIFLGAFYLYFINAFFISLATYLICMVLRFPRRAELDNETSVWMQRLIIAGAILISIPSGVIFYDVLRKAKFDRGVRTFVEKAIKEDDRQPIRWDIDTTKDPDVLKVYVVGRPVSPAEKAELRSRMDSFGIGELELNCVQLNMARSEIVKLSTNVENDVAERFRIISAIDEAQENEITRLTSELNALRARTDPDILILNEIKLLDPAILSAKWKEPAPAEQNEVDTGRIVIITVEPETQIDKLESIRSKVEKYLAERRADYKVGIELLLGASNENEPEK
ncbi:MAG: DUF389 domain-containing protein [Pyrinomonadaceae bacterium]